MKDYKALHNPAGFLRKATMSLAPEVWLPKVAYFAALKTIKHEFVDPSVHPTSRNSILVPQVILKEVLARYNNYIIANSHYWAQHTITRTMLGQGDKPILSLHKRIRTLLPKCNGMLSSLFDGQGGIAVTPQEIDVAIRYTRQFWTLPPPDMPPHLLDLLI